MSCKDSDSEYELAEEHFNDESIDRKISEAIGQEPISKPPPANLSAFLKAREKPKKPTWTEETSDSREKADKSDKTEAAPEVKKPDPYTEDELVEVKEQALVLKDEGNTLYKTADAGSALNVYTRAILLCREQLDELRSVLHANRAACHVM